ncbi:hypothetical protein J6590_069872 [Homalodisca vitripennis]|nr:hypothetical protein J6590_069872 [Homalodisca vitripennis]
MAALHRAFNRASENTSVHMRALRRALKRLSPWKLKKLYVFGFCIVDINNEDEDKGNTGFIQFHVTDVVLTPIAHGYPTRNAVSVGLQVPVIKLSINLTNAYYVANTLYRQLPSVIRDLQDEPVSGFKRLVTAWLRMIGPDNAEFLLTPTYRY